MIARDAPALTRGQVAFKILLRVIVVPWAVVVTLFAVLAVVSLLTIAQTCPAAGCILGSARSLAVSAIVAVELQILPGLAAALFALRVMRRHGDLVLLRLLPIVPAMAVLCVISHEFSSQFWPWTKPQTSSFEGFFAVLWVEFVTLLIAAWPFLQRYAAADS
jgi:hypothetical protein